MTRLRAQALAGLTVCESMLIALVDLGVLSSEEAENLLLDAENAHLNAGGSEEEIEIHREVAHVIRLLRRRADGVSAVSGRDKTDTPTGESSD